MDKEMATSPEKKAALETIRREPRGGGIRFSPHFYTPRADLARALELLANYT